MSCPLCGAYEDGDENDLPYLPESATDRAIREFLHEHRDRYDAIEEREWQREYEAAGPNRKVQLAIHRKIRLATREFGARMDQMLLKERWITNASDPLR